MYPYVWCKGLQKRISRFKLVAIVLHKFYTNLIFSCCFFFSFPACDKGYTGHNCEDVCPFPSYGLDCQSICNCAETQCNPVNGCNGYLTGFVNKKKIFGFIFESKKFVNTDYILLTVFSLFYPGFFFLLNFSVENERNL